MTGHSLGGAMAFIAPLALVDDPLWKKAQGVYTFGQPMITEAAGYEEKCRKLIGAAISLHGRLLRWHCPSALATPMHR